MCQEEVAKKESRPKEEELGGQKTKVGVNAAENSVLVQGDNLNPQKGDRNESVSHLAGRLKKNVSEKTKRKAGG